MFYILFKNNLGEIKFSGDGSSPFSLTGVTGLGLPDKYYQTREYLDSDGQTTVSSRFTARTITLAFDLKGDNVSSLTASLYRILSQSGTLTVVSSNSQRSITVNQITVDSFTEKGYAYRSFTAQFTCDDPFFRDLQAISLPCYQLINNIRYDSENGSWNLDTSEIWGETSNDMQLINSGDFKSFPIFTVYSYGDAIDDGGFEILRVNSQNPAETLQRFALNYALTDGESVTLCFNPRSDLNRRYIKSSKGTNLLNHRSENSSLSDFYLDCGENRLIVNNLSQGNELSASVSYENQYIEGVF